MEIQVKNIILPIILLPFVFLMACDETLLGPKDDNHSNEERLLSDPAFAEGLLINAYAFLPNNYRLDEVATDDAVTNDVGTSYRRIATGEWSSVFNPLSVWNSAYQAIYYINYFLSINDDIDYAWDDRGSPSNEREAAFRKRFKGEALALRAWFNFELLKKHGGIDENNNPMGFVIMKEPLKRDEATNLPRNSYSECVQFILEDIKMAISLLPQEYFDKSSDVVHNAVFGEQNKNRINGLFAKALKSRVTLHVASMGFNTEPNAWEIAAKAAADLLVPIGGTEGLSKSGVEFWKNENDSEILFRRDYSNSNNREKANYPPSLYGRGETNPSQNLVDAFPMANGYPINDARSGYEPRNPYDNRDPRLQAYILYNGNRLNNAIIKTNVEESLDGLNQSIASTRTGFYLKKLLIPTVNLTPNLVNTKRHFYTLFRYTEMFLNYAESANEAWGPDEDPEGYGFTPRQIIQSIRERGGIIQPDEYLKSILTQHKMRDLIQNERRLELSFEGFRFWDIRRWNLDLTQPVKGVQIRKDNYSEINVENRAFAPYMQYGPIPNIEILKGDALTQNAGW